MGATAMYHNFSSAESVIRTSSKLKKRAKDITNLCQSWGLQTVNSPYRISDCKNENTFLHNVCVCQENHSLTSLLSQFPMTVYNRYLTRHAKRTLFSCMTQLANTSLVGLTSKSNSETSKYMYQQSNNWLRVCWIPPTIIPAAACCTHWYE